MGNSINKLGYVCLSCSYLDELSVAGECAAEYLALYQKLIKPAHWKVYLAARGVLPYVGNLITKVTQFRNFVWLLILKRNSRQTGKKADAIRIEGLF